MKRLATLAFTAIMLGAAAPDPADKLADPAQEARARALFPGVRCVVCQNESIDDSGADLARDLRQTIRAQVAAGRSDAEIHAFLVARYGDFILLRPRLGPATVALWGLPFAIVLIGVGVLAFRRGAPREAEALSDEEIRALEEMDKTSHP